MPRLFQFKLQRVLDYRIQLEDRARHALALARRDQQEQVRLIESLKEESCNSNSNFKQR